MKHIAQIRNPRGIRNLRKRYKGCLDEIRVYCAKKETDAHSIHHLRVNLKRVDALISLLAFHDKKPSKKIIHEFSSLFKIAGKVRSAQVEFDVINRYIQHDSTNTDYLHQLHENKLKARAKFFSYLKNGLSRSTQKGIEKLKDEIDELTNDDIRQYLHSEEKYLTRRLAKSIFRQPKLHAMRKDLKRFYLNLTISEDKHETIETLLELIGKWHDYQVAFEHVTKALYTGNFTEVEAAAVGKIRTELITEKENLYDEIISFYRRSGLYM